MQARIGIRHDPVSSEPANARRALAPTFASSSSRLPRLIFDNSIAGPPPDGGPDSGESWGLAHCHGAGVKGAGGGEADP
jgi:hypothetical protein